MQHIVIIGAGIIGAAIACNLQSASTQVTIVDAGNANATNASFGWINASFFANDHHFALRQEGMKAYGRLPSDLELPINWSGCLCWENEGAALDAQYEELVELGYDVKLIDAQEFARLEPNVPDVPERSLYFNGEAAADSGELAKALLLNAVKNGARHIAGTQVTDFKRDGKKVVGVETTAGAISSDDVVIAAGTSTGNLASMLGVQVPMLDRPGLMIRTKPIRPFLEHVLVSETGEVRQLPDGSVIMPAAVGHQGDTATHITGNVHEHADQAMGRLRNLLPNADLELAQMTLAYRPVPQDGLPVVGRILDGAYVATLHSGITLAALMGELIASELSNEVSHKTEKWLSLYRPKRFESA